MASKTPEGILLKKCSREWHKPATNKACAAGTCQHTCAAGTIGKCAHKWTARYSVNGKQSEKSFADKKHASDFLLKLAHDKRAEGAVFIDHAKTGRENFGEAINALIKGEQVTEATRANHRSVCSKWVMPLLGSRTLAQVANMRDEVEILVTVKMAHLSYQRRNMALFLITSTLDRAVKSGKLSGHRVTDIELANNSVNAHPDFVFPTFGQISKLADALGIVIWLMRGCGLRISEALAVEKSDFRNGGRTLRVSGQVDRRTGKKVALKHRKEGEWRDAPVPTWLWEKVRDLPDGPLCPGASGQRYAGYSGVYAKFVRQAKAVGIPGGFHPHSLRHLFASVMLGQDVQITDVAKWLGHKNINETYRTYGHLLPNANDKAIAALDAEWSEWSKPALKAA